MIARRQGHFFALNRVSSVKWADLSSGCDSIQASDPKAERQKTFRFFPQVSVVKWADLSSGWDVIEYQKVLRPESGHPIPTRLKIIQHRHPAA